jgi:RNA polymerase sigma factor (TIGR02999 family)
MDLLGKGAAATAGGAGLRAQDRREFDALYSAVYEELRRLAASVRRRPFGSSLTPTTLVHEAWVKLARNPELASLPIPHFQGVAARAMRQVLVEAARRKRSRKRGGEHAFVTFDESLVAAPSAVDEVLLLDAAIEELARRQPRHAHMVELRFFGGLDVATTAKILEVSQETVHRDWRLVRAWLQRTCRAQAESR